MRAVISLLFMLPLLGCGAVAAPCRIASAGLNIIPIVGGIASTPADACAETID